MLKKEVILMRKHSWWLWSVILAGLLVSGCAVARYGKLQMPERTEAVTVETLVRDWEGYEIYYAGLHSGHPSAVLFERKDDDRGFMTERWFKVRNKDMLDDLVDSIQRQLPISGYYPRLWKVMGPEGYLYGYMFTAWDHAVMKAVDERTLFVNDLPMPPYLMIDGDGPSFRTP
jgi:hypothetical protein